MSSRYKILLAILIVAVAAICFAQVVNESPGDSSETRAEAEPPAPEKQPPTETEGENCFSLFRADADGHCWENAYLLALACHYNYHEKLEVEPFEDFRQFEEKYRQLFSLWGLDTFEFIQSSGRTFDTELIVMSPTDGDFVIVVFRGSERIEGPVGAAKDAILTDANIKLLDVSDALGEGVAVHAGFCNAFIPVKDAVVEAIDKQGGFAPTKKLWITGNSLGAALANLCAISLRAQGHDVHAVYTYGAPRCGNQRFRERYENDFAIKCQSWVNDNDIVPKLPPNGLLPDYQHVGVINNIDSDGSVTLNDTEHEGIGNPLKHYQEFYAYRIYHALPPQLKRKMPPPPPLPALVKPLL